MKTTFQEMLDKIKSREWQLVEDGPVRCANGLCPILAAAYELAHDAYVKLYGEDWDSMNFDQAADLIGLTIDYYIFIDAVDYNEEQIRRVWGKYSPARCNHLIRTRRRVLKALGLTEQAV